MKENLAPEVIIKGLSVQYPGEVVALDHLDLPIGQGVFGLLGPNGAGKTTLLRTLATLQRPTGGCATVSGCDVEHNSAQVRQLLGYLPQDFQTYPQLGIFMRRSSRLPSNQLH